MNIGFIGAGRAGSSLGIYFKRYDMKISGFYSPHYDSAKGAADSTESTVFSDFEAVIENSDIIILSTPDGQIKNVCDALSKCKNSHKLKGKIIAHLSGALTSGELDSARALGAACVSTHPMMAISSKDTDFTGVHFTLEGDEVAVIAFEHIYGICGNKTERIAAEHKAKYHCASAVYANLSIALMDIALDMLEECEISREDGIDLLKPLAIQNVQSLCSKGPEMALTGPLERADLPVIKGHIKSMNGNKYQELIYRLLSLKLVEVGERKHKGDRDYSEIKDFLKQVK